MTRQRLAIRRWDTQLSKAVLELHAAEEERL